MRLAWCTAPADPDETASCAVELPAGDKLPAWVVLMRAGEVVARDGRRWRLTDPEAVVAATRAQAGTTDLVVDYEHQTQHSAGNGQPAPAAGWIRELRARGGAIEARVEWTARAAAMLRAREYRYISPVFAYAKGGGVLRMHGAGLTNSPALDLPALARRKDGGHMSEAIKKLLKKLNLAADADDAAVAAAQARLAAGAAATSGLRRVAEALGKAADTAPEAVVSAACATADALRLLASALGQAADAPPEALVTAARARPEAPKPGEFVPRAEFDAVASQLRTLQAERSAERATAAVDAAVAAGKVVPAARAWALGYARQDLAGFAKYVEAQPVLVAAGAQPPAGGNPGAALTGDELAVCRSLGITESAFLASRKADLAAAETGGAA